VSLKTDLLELARSPREVWVIYALNVFDSIGFFAVYNVLSVYLSEDLKFGDVSGGSLAGTWLTVVAVMVFVAGIVADSLGTRRALMLAFTSALVGRLAMTFSTERSIAITGLFLAAWGTSSGLPTMTAALRRYTKPASTPFAFSLFYVALNAGALIAPLTVASFRGRIGKAGIDLPLVGHATSSQAIFAVASCVTMVGLLVTFFLVRSSVPGETPQRAARPWTILGELAKERAFWRFMLFVSLLVTVRLSFQHAHLTWPKYTLRELAPDFPFARWWSINPAMIIVLTPLATMLTRKRSPFWTIVIGGSISSLAILPMALSSSLGASVAYVVLLSLGETLWSPRLYEYTTVIAPQGREGSYMGLSQVPYFFAKPVAGFMSGVLLARYCPQHGERNSKMMWLIVGAATIAGPILIVLLRRVIEGRESEAKLAPAPAA
jgi:dipeptide/tripeptide permease